MIKKGSLKIYSAAWGHISLLVLVAVFFFYFRNLPSTVQFGDTGELVADAFKYQVPHPSGYPLFINLYFAFIHAVGWGSVFFRASLLTSLLSLATLLLFFKTDGKPFTRYLALSLGCCLAFSKIFWRYSVLPDVYALQCLLVTGVLWFYVNERKNSAIYATLLFGLSLTNHITSLALAPMIAHLWILHFRNTPRKQGIKNLAVALSGGALGLMLIYGSLLQMHPESFYSWGKIDRPSDIIHHFLREDYGRNRKPLSLLPLSHIIEEYALADEGVPEGSQFKKEMKVGFRYLLNPWAPEFIYYGSYFLEQSGKDLFPALLILIAFGIYGIQRRKGDPKAVLLSATAFIYCYGIFALIKIKPQADSLIVVERFLLLPQILLCYSAVLFFRHAEYHQQSGELRVLFIGLITVPLIFGGLNLARYAGALNYSDNTIVEDYAVNWLKILPQNDGTLVLVENDTEYFALRYVQQIFDKNPKTWVLSPPLLFLPWYSQKLQQVDPTFSFDTLKITSSLDMNLQKDLIVPNASTHQIYSTRKYGSHDLNRFVWSSVGKKLIPRKTLSNEEPKEADEFLTPQVPLQFRSDLSAARSPLLEYDPTRQLYAQYADPILGRANTLIAANQLLLSKAALLAALERVPFCRPALSGLCMLMSFENSKNAVNPDTVRCENTLKLMASTQVDYY